MFLWSIHDFEIPIQNHGRSGCIFTTASKLVIRLF